jgi:hypothetical protein
VGVSGETFDEEIGGGGLIVPMVEQCDRFRSLRVDDSDWYKISVSGDCDSRTPSL